MTRPQRALVRYQGVFRHGDRAAAWLTLALLAAILVSYFGLQRRAWQQGGSDK